MSIPWGWQSIRPKPREKEHDSSRNGPQASPSRSRPDMTCRSYLNGRDASQSGFQALPGGLCQQSVEGISERAVSTRQKDQTISQIVIGGEPLDDAGALRRI